MLQTQDKEAVQLINRLRMYINLILSLIVMCMLYINHEWLLQWLKKIIQNQ
jgi:Na+-driven multidrug efflux pump